MIETSQVLIGGDDAQRFWCVYRGLSLSCIFSPWMIFYSKHALFSFPLSIAIRVTYICCPCLFYPSVSAWNENIPFSTMDLRALHRHYSSVNQHGLCTCRTRLRRMETVALKSRVWRRHLWNKICLNQMGFGILWIWHLCSCFRIAQ
jgi:hypothetical protein